MPNYAKRMSFISLQLIFPKAELILKTFTFAPYCYPYAPPSTALSTQPSTLNLRPCSYSNTLASQIHAVPGIRAAKFVNYSSQEREEPWPFTRTSEFLPAVSLMPSVPVT